jgi:tRNA/tmRNA/rRNA uracil-C5-methylase (TrmA/RlmC/RlmD family)
MSTTQEITKDLLDTNKQLIRERKGMLTKYSEAYEQSTDSRDKVALLIGSTLLTMQIENLRGKTETTEKKLEEIETTLVWIQENLDTARQDWKTCPVEEKEKALVYREKCRHLEVFLDQVARRYVELLSKH